jgi:4a-hydroxytetrahydrobiopterin dehydratase
MIEKLDPKTTTNLLAALQHWHYNEQLGAISREFTFADFAQAFAFMTQLAIVAEKRDHHPEWFNVYNRVQITLTTHDVNGLSQRDMDMAHYADGAFARFQPSHATT